ncbi:hypothetical protein ABZ307_31025 [Streptomyces griseorubiginosus]
MTAGHLGRRRTTHFGHGDRTTDSDHGDHTIASTQGDRMTDSHGSAV